MRLWCYWRSEVVVPPMASCSQFPTHWVQCTKDRAETAWLLLCQAVALYIRRLQAIFTVSFDTLHVFFRSARDAAHFWPLSKRDETCLQATVACPSSRLITTECKFSDFVERTQ
ncbi:hypothetical protein SISNIDRAFT_134959 [Sistotremastrum niveocremeum HHB9708]|uniref:Uncharacterized protein n=1 Tax=Sistotremastrum niveocremeum HHB9708 TaxID=1314777 RepID=A0A164ZXN1_9AGAM|nr:hypothetical protein SISNIDRAFT_134959 [Sistotremastrum niveocremeum HHB9708]